MSAPGTCVPKQIRESLPAKAHQAGQVLGPVAEIVDGEVQGDQSAGAAQRKELVECFEDEQRFLLDLRGNSWDEANLTQFKELFGLREEDFSLGQRKAAGYFLNRWTKSKWMRDQRGYREKIALILSAKSTATSMRPVFCRPWRLCLHPQCPRCNYFLKVAPVNFDFTGAYDKATEQGLHFVGLVPSFTFSARTAGLHFVLRKLPNGKPKDWRHDRPFELERDWELLNGDDDEPLITTLLDRLLRYPRQLKKLGLIEGAFFQPEYKISFHRRKTDPTNLQVVDAFLPHCNLTITTKHRPDWHWAYECWQAWQRLCASADLNPVAAYPDLFVGRHLESEEELTTWLSYSLKVEPFEEWYAEAVKSGCPLYDLNAQFSQSVFSYFLVWSGKFKGPHRLGNLHPNHRHRLVQKRPAREKIRAIQETLRRIRDGDQSADLSSEDLRLLDLQISPEFLQLQRAIRTVRQRGMQPAPIKVEPEDSL